MILVLDVGNTNIKCGLFEDNALKHSWRMSSDKDITSDELGLTICSFLNYLHIESARIHHVVVSCVIPSLNYTITHMCSIYFHLLPLMVGPGIKTGINILYENPRELGSDRIVNAVAAFDLYGGPIITIDFGTATSYGALSKKGEFLGGAICPGIKVSSEALTTNAAKLPHVDIKKTTSVINKTTVSCMQSGIFYGYVGQVDYILRKMKAEIGGSCKVVATGGLADLIATETNMIDIIDPLLTLRGLHIIYKKNCENGGTNERS